MVAAFCERLGWHDLETLVSSFQKRVLVGARPEILALTEVRHVKAYTARLLYKAGIRTPEALASITDYKRVASILAAGRKSQPGGIKANVAREQAMLRQQAVRIVRSAKEYMQWRAQQLKVDAAAALQLAEQISKRPVDPLISAGNGAVHSPAVHQGAVVPSSQSFDLLKAEEERAEEGQGGSSQVSLAQHVPPLAVQTASPPSDEPDPWEGGRAVGAIILTEASQVEALRAFLEGSRRYARFAFQFDSVEPTARALPAGMVMPDRPSAARGPGGKQAPGEHAVQADVKPSVLGVALSWRSGQAFYVPLRNRADLKATVGQIFSNPRLEKVTFDLKGQLAVLRRAWGGAGSSFIGPPFMDVRIAAFMLTPDDSRLWDIQAEPSHLRGPAASKRFSPEALATSRLGQAAVAAAVQSMHRAPNASASDARKIDVCRMAAATCTTFAHLVTQLKADGAAAALAQVEMPIVPVLVTMESSGVGVDPGALRAEMPTLQRRMQELETLAIGVAGEPFDISVPSECSRALFELVGLPPPPAAQAARDGGGWSTKSDALQELAVQYPECPLPGMIAEHRTLTKLLDWCDDLLQRCGASGNGNHSGLVRVRGSFNQTRAITGRLSMDEPNLQTVPRSIEFTVTVTPTSKGAAELAPVTSPDRRRQVCNLRRAFVAPPGRVLLCCDYRQLELRLVAHFSGDPALIHMLSDGAVDPFVGMAATWLKVAPVSAVTLAQRSKAKKMAYGILYGMVSS